MQRKLTAQCALGAIASRMPVAIVLVFDEFGLHIGGVEHAQLFVIEFARPFGPIFDVDVEHAVLLIEVGHVVQIDADVDGVGVHKQRKDEWQQACYW